MVSVPRATELAAIKVDTVIVDPIAVAEPVTSPFKTIVSTAEPPVASDCHREPL